MIEVIRVGDSAPVGVVAVSPAPTPIVIPVGSGGTSGPGLQPYEHVQLIPQSVWLVQHNLGRYPVAWSMFNEQDFEASEYSVQHLDLNTLRVSVDMPVAGLFRCI